MSFRRFQVKMTLIGLCASLSACGFENRKQDALRAEGDAALPMRLTLAEDAPTVWGTPPRRLEIVKALQEAASVWNQASGLRLFQFDGSRAPVSSSAFRAEATGRDGRNTIFIFENFGDPRETLGLKEKEDILGLCVTIEGRHEADIALTLTATLPDWEEDSQGERRMVKALDILEHRSAKDSYDFVSVAVHELGHALGLGHEIQDEGSVMWVGGLMPGKVNRGLSQTDKRNLEVLLAEKFGIDVDLPDSTDPDPSPLTN